MGVAGESQTECGPSAVVGRSFGELVARVVEGERAECRRVGCRDPRLGGVGGDVVGVGPGGDHPRPVGVARGDAGPSEQRGHPGEVRLAVEPPPAARGQVAEGLGRSERGPCERDRGRRHGVGVVVRGVGGHVLRVAGEGEGLGRGGRGAEDRVEVVEGLGRTAVEVVEQRRGGIAHPRGIRAGLVGGDLRGHREGHPIGGGRRGGERRTGDSVRAEGGSALERVPGRVGDRRVGGRVQGGGCGLDDVARGDAERVVGCGVAVHRREGRRRGRRGGECGLGQFLPRHHRVRSGDVRDLGHGHAAGRGELVEVDRLALGVAHRPLPGGNEDRVDPPGVDGGRDLLGEPGHGPDRTERGDGAGQGDSRLDLGAVVEREHADRGDGARCRGRQAGVEPEGVRGVRPRPGEQGRGGDRRPGRGLRDRIDTADVVLGDVDAEAAAVGRGRGDALAGEHALLPARVQHGHGDLAALEPAVRPDAEAERELEPAPREDEERDERGGRRGDTSHEDRSETNSAQVVS